MILEPITGTFGGDYKHILQELFHSLLFSLFS